MKILRVLGLYRLVTLLRYQSGGNHCACVGVTRYLLANCEERQYFSAFERLLREFPHDSSPNSSCIAQGMNVSD